MSRLADMLERLPTPYRIDGSLLRQLLSLVALAQTTFDEDMDRVQRSHWVDQAFDRGDLERLGALFDVPAAAWEDLEFYRGRLKATIAARFQGSVTREDLALAVVRILRSAEEALGLRYSALPEEGVSELEAFQLINDAEHPRPAVKPDALVFREFLRQLRRPSELVARGGRITMLDRLTVVNRGIGPVPLQGVLRGVEANRTAVPVVANLRNGTIAGYAGLLRCGQELTLSVDPASQRLRATLGDLDVSERVISSSKFVPGQAFQPLLPDPEARPVMLEPGSNELWFLCMAFYDVPGLSAAMLQPTPLTLRQGVFGQKATPEAERTRFDELLFHQGPTLVADLWWEEAQAATFRMELPGVVLRQVEPGAGRDPDREHQRLLELLEHTVDQLRAASVDGGIRLRPLTETQRVHDRVTVVRPDMGAETTRSTDALTALSALFDITAVDKSRFE